MAGVAAVVTRLGAEVLPASSQAALLQDVAVLAAGVALDDARLAVTGKVVGAAALVAGGTARTGPGSSTGGTGTLGTSGNGGTAVGGAVLQDVAELAAVVALQPLSLSGAVQLDVADVTTRVALLGGGLLGLGAVAGLVAGLAAVVAQSLLLGAVVGQVADLTTLVTRSREHRSHLFFLSFSIKRVVCKRRELGQEENFFFRLREWGGDAACANQLCDFTHRRSNTRLLTS